MRTRDELFAALQQSPFRQRFRLEGAELEHARHLGWLATRAQAEHFVRMRLASAEPLNDGQQTPMRGHPVFVAQHATATCCRSCLAKWHQIPAGRSLSEAEIEHIIAVLLEWLQRQCESLTMTPLAWSPTALGALSVSSVEATDSRPPRVIVHVDMDAFYASVEERDDPSLVGKPVIVGGWSKGRGVVAAANYVVRRFGVHSAMPTAQALRLCPEAIVIRPRLSHYAVVSGQILAVLERYSPVVEPLSLDEAFLDVTGGVALFGSPQQLGEQLKAEIKAATGLTASVGIGPNKFVAKIASDLHKPDALVIVPAEAVAAFLEPLPVGRLWGVGKVTGQTLAQFGLTTIADVRRADAARLRAVFGSQADHFTRLSWGLDDRPVVSDREARSISNESTFATDLDDAEALRAWLLELTEHVARRLRAHHWQGKTIQLKVRFGDFQTITRSKTLREPTCATQTIWETAQRLLEQVLATDRRAIRLLGVGLTGLTRQRQVQRSLFAEEPVTRTAELDAATDAIRQRFGFDALGRASGLLHQAEHHPEPKPGEKRSPRGRKHDSDRHEP